MKKSHLLAITLLVSQWTHADRLECRLSGGAIDNNPASISSSNGPLSLFAGQVGANTALPPQAKGQVIISTINGNPAGIFTFGAGTSSAPEGTEVDRIVCSNPGWCGAARPAPVHTIAFSGIGTFRNINPTSQISGLTGAFDTSPTYHWFDVTIWDQGEPGVKADESGCPPEGPTFEPNCNCPDWYKVTIYAGVQSDGSASVQSDVIYEASGYIDGGNLQIHPVTGFDQY